MQFLVENGSAIPALQRKNLMFNSILNFENLEVQQQQQTADQNQQQINKLYKKEFFQNQELLFNASK